MNTKTISPYSISSLGFNFNPAKNLKPEVLSKALDSFENGRLSSAVRIFESILKRDDLICGLALKRKKSISRLEYEIVNSDSSQKSKAHAKVLSAFYANLKCSSFLDKNLHGNLRLLISQMMDSVAMRYSVHKIEYSSTNGNVRASFTQYPLWLFENTSGKLRILNSENQIENGKTLNPSQWLISCGDGLMLASSIAYLFKQIPLRDWLIYCERNGMPGIKAKTDAFPGTPQWESACQAVNDFGAEFNAVLSQGTDIEAIDISTKGELPYKDIIERTDRMLCALWRGGDLSSMSAKNSIGSDMQEFESTLIEEDDASTISETLNEQVDKNVIKLAFGDDEPLAKIKLKLPDYDLHKDELEIIERLTALGLEPDKIKLARMFAFPISGESSNEE